MLTRYLDTILLVAVLAGALLMHPARGQGIPAVDGVCPTERPNLRQYTKFSSVVTCTAIACVPRLVCGSERCSYMPVTDCNRCTPISEEGQLCLSDEELERAK